MTNSLNLTKRAKRVSYLRKNNERRQLNKVYSNDPFNLPISNQQTNMGSLRNRSGILGFINKLRRTRKNKANKSLFTQRNRNTNLSQYGI